MPRLEIYLCYNSVIWEVAYTHEFGEWWDQLDATLRKEGLI